ncbi:TMP-TENI-domain-containing protein [Melanomma pulvis-pyrius CBS 109.77]|uniref:TMP-TENI-domain-containing protein n=1 Tax=Melanomma pulvis-pyrius CBS 109.77 TaxID=1314802 RepID=A0A6A6WWF0_9PLEO|nr:TMP-TENI-domain-containing protein [Melanomma pulvis-pyrius CBS 109.77]
MKPQVDYSLYLVTDSTAAILGDRNLVEVVEQALLGGVTVVQYRDKSNDTGVLISTAKQLHKICQQHSVPLIINDRVDVALAVGCEGVHLGQDDMGITNARQILGDDKIIGATVSSIDEAKVAVEAGADYLGIGTLYATATKKNTKDIIGINGIRKILYYLGHQAGEASQSIKTVCIGGINASNLKLVHHRLYAPSSNSERPKTIDGVAIVSAIIAAKDVREATANLKSLPPALPPFEVDTADAVKSSEEEKLLAAAIPRIIRAVHEKGPLSHNMTNLVVQNFAASVALAIGASPIMSNNGDEAADLAKIGGGLVINMGTATPDSLANHRKAITAYNAAGGPIVLDPVGAGATTARRDALSFLMASGYFDLIKGNEREILGVARASGFILEDSSQQRGVDSGASLLTLAEKAYLVSRIARRERNVVLMTGAVDVISDGTTTYSISNGHAYLGMVTGSGCTLGTTLAAFMSAHPQHKLHAAIAGILHFELAAEAAAARPDVKGPGTFVPAFIDELYHRRIDVVESRVDWLDRAAVKRVAQIPDAALLKEM